MNYGEIVSSVRADLTGLDKDLTEARKRLRQFYDDASRMAAGAHGGAAVSAGGVGGGFANDNFTRRIEQARMAAEAEQRRFRAVQEAAFRENNARIQETARTFFRAQSGLSSPGGGIGGGPGAFLAPASLRGLDEASAKWIRQQEEIQKARESVGGFRQQLETLGKRTFAGLTEKAKQFAGTVATIGSAAVVGGLTALAAEALKVDRQYQVGRIALAETLSLTTDLVTRQGRLVDSSKQMSVNYADSAKLYQSIRAEAIRTTLTTSELLQNVEQSLAYATAGGAKLQEVVPLIAQISNLSKSLGAVGPREQGFEIRALLTGQMLSRSRIGRALGISKADIDNAKAAGNIVGFLNERLKAGRPYLTDYANSFDGLVSTLRSKGDELLRQGTEKTFARITASLGDINKRFDDQAITRWADRLSEALTQAAERINTLASLPVWQTLAKNFGFLFFDQGEAADRELAEKRAARGPERTAVEKARLAVGEHRRALQRAQDAASLHGFQAADRAGATVRLAPAYESIADRRAVEVQRRELERAQRQEVAAEDALRRAHVANELKKMQASAETFRRVSRMHAEQSQKAKQDAEDERVSVAKQLADLRGDKIASLRADAEAQLRDVAQNVKSESNRSALIRAIRAKLHRDIQDLRNQDLAQQQQYYTKSRDLVTNYRDDQQRMQTERAHAEQQFADLQQQTAQQARQILRERLEGERTLIRAQQDRLASIQRIGNLQETERRRVTHPLLGLQGPHGGVAMATEEEDVVTRPATMGIEGQREALRQEASQLFAQGNISRLIQQALQARGQSPELAGAETQRTLRQLSEAAIQPEGNGVADILGSIGITNLSPGLSKSLQSLQARGVGLANQEAALSDQARQQALQRAREDQGKPVEDARKTLRDLTDQQTALTKTYRESVQALRDGLNKQLAEATRGMRSLGEEAQKLARTLATHHFAVPADLSRILVAQGGSRAGTHGGGIAPGPVNNYFQFGPGSLQVPGLTRTEIKKAVTELLTTEARNAAPPRR